MGTHEGETEAGDAAMVCRVTRLAQAFRDCGLREGEQFHAEEVEGGIHNEAAWSGRFDRVLRFLFPYLSPTPSQEQASLRKHVLHGAQEG